MRWSISGQCLDHGLGGLEGHGDGHDQEDHDLPGTEPADVMDQDVVKVVDGLRHVDGEHLQHGRAHQHQRPVL